MHLLFFKAESEQKHEDNFFGGRGSSITKKTFFGGGGGEIKKFLSSNFKYFVCVCSLM